MLTVASSRQEIDLRGSLSKLNSQLYLVSYLRLTEACIIVLKKSDLMKILGAIPPKERSNAAASQHQQNLSDMKVVIVNGMEYQAIDKPKFGGNMSILHLICIAMQVLMKKPTQKLFSMLLRQEKKKQLS